MTQEQYREKLHELDQEVRVLEQSIRDIRKRKGILKERMLKDPEVVPFVNGERVALYKDGQYVQDGFFAEAYHTSWDLRYRIHRVKVGGGMSGLLVDVKLFDEVRKID